jgi:alpha-tubulin suppressor-like RCC1 family protein
MNKLYLLFLFLTLSHTFFAQGTWKTVSVGSGFSVALHSDGTLWSWGVNNLAQLGIGTASLNGGPGLSYNNVPIKVLTPYHDWVEVDCAEAYTIALRADGTLWGWGCKKLQSIGTHILDYVPEQIGQDSNFVSISAGNNFYSAIKADGTLWTWGFNVNGQLGRNDTTSWVEIPAQVGSSSDWKQVSCGGAHSLGLDSAGHLYFWGAHSWGINYGTIQYRPLFVIHTSINMSVQAIKRLLPFMPTDRYGSGALILAVFWDLEIPMTVLCLRKLVLILIGRKFTVDLHFLWV